MTEKSHVGMEYHVCPICVKRFETGCILLDRRLRQSLERETVTGWELCPECDARHKAGYIALVAVRNEKGLGTLKPSEVYREGTIVHVRREAAVRLMPELQPHIDKPLVWVPKALCIELARLETERAQEEGEKGGAGGPGE